MGAENGLWDALLLASKLIEHETLNQLYELIDDLPTEIRAELAQRLLMSLEPSTVFGHKPLSSPMQMRLNLMDREGLASVLCAIADRMGGIP